MLAAVVQVLPVLVEAVPVAARRIARQRGVPDRADELAPARRCCSKKGNLAERPLNGKSGAYVERSPGVTSSRLVERSGECCRWRRRPSVRQRRLRGFGRIYVRSLFAKGNRCSLRIAAPTHAGKAFEHRSQTLSIFLSHQKGNLLNLTVTTLAGRPSGTMSHRVPRVRIRAFWYHRAADGAALISFLTD